MAAMGHIDGSVRSSQSYRSTGRSKAVDWELSNVAERLTALHAQMVALRRARHGLGNTNERNANQACFLALATEQRELMVRRRLLISQGARQEKIGIRFDWP